MRGVSGGESWNIGKRQGMGTGCGACNIVIKWLLYGREHGLETCQNVI